MKMRRLLAPLVIATLTLARTALADDSSAQPTARVFDAARIHHAPLSVVADHEEIVVRATVERPDLSPRVLLLFRAGGAIQEVPFERTEDGFAAVIPANAVRPPSFAYAIEGEPRAGQRIALFASRDAMHDVTVRPDLADERERATLARLDGRRSLIQLSTEYAYFGTATATPTDAGSTPANVRDEFWRTDASYTYRILRRVSEFGIRAGVVRGSAVVDNAKVAKEYAVGLNYGAPRLRFRLVDWLHTDIEGLVSVTEVGFSVGGGGAIILGDPIGNHLTIGGEGIQVFGGRGWVRLDAILTRRFALAPQIEVTTMPHAGSAGVRLLVDARMALGYGFALTLRTGYQARSFDKGGPTLGATVDLAF